MTAAFDSPDPHFARKLATVRSSEELDGFWTQLREDRRKAGTGLTADEYTALMDKGRRLRGVGA